MLASQAPNGGNLLVSSNSCDMAQGTPTFPSLKSVVIDNCLGLEKLPFDFNLAKRKLTLIQGQQNWWDSLKWDDPTAKHKFQSKFKSYDDYSNIVRVCRSTYFPVPAS
ncbi:hypothetical protein K1719_021111 [Acacia pycnantha]|nr:hypothetical protein K1719_021111 [Acacia pycnantha]